MGDEVRAKSLRKAGWVTATISFKELNAATESKSNYAGHSKKETNIFMALIWANLSMKPKLGL